MKKIRLDQLLVERGLADSRSLAQRLVMAGQIRVNGETVLRSAANVASDVHLEVEPGPRFVSRGGEKLEAALQAFELGVSEQICADVGSSTGGFTDCLLQHAAAKVYAIDVGQGILDWKLRRDRRVVVMEGTNARYLERLPEPVDMITVDASFISLRVLLPVIKNWFLIDINNSKASKGKIIALIKPQFEAGRKDAAKGGGVIRDRTIHRKVLEQTLRFAEGEGFNVEGLIQSPITGPKGNVEFLFHLKIPFKSPFALPVLIEKWLRED